MENFLTGIKKVEIAYVSDISISYEEKLSRGVPVSVVGQFTDICIDGLASVVYETNRVSGQNVYTTTLVFRSGSIDTSVLTDSKLNKAVLFMLTGVDGKQYLLGTPQPPHPVCVARRANTAEPTGVNIDEYEFTYTNLFPFLEIKQGI